MRKASHIKIATEEPLKKEITIHQMNVYLKLNLIHEMQKKVVLSLDILTAVCINQLTGVKLIAKDCERQKFQKFPYSRQQVLDLCFTLLPPSRQLYVQS